MIIVVVSLVSRGIMLKVDIIKQNMIVQRLKFDLPSDVFDFSAMPSLVFMNSLLDLSGGPAMLVCLTNSQDRSIVESADREYQRRVDSVGGTVLVPYVNA